MPIRIVVGDDSPCTLSAVRRALQEEPGIRIVGEALVFSATMQMMGDFKPEVLLFDLHMPEKRNFTTTFSEPRAGNVGRKRRSSHSTG